MKVLLHADIAKLGYFGDVVEVKDGRALVVPDEEGLLPPGE